ncbi:MAG: OmpA family protein [Muribaculaceae bacterium]|nr:OmpA family protein [Muribaculaceae bacterium]
MKLRHMILCVMAAMAAAASAQTADSADLSLEEHINTPVIERKRHAAVVEKAQKLSASLRSKGLRTNTLRNDEVVLATLPCDALFAANATEPKYEALSRLRALAEVAGLPEEYKVLVAVHSDDTGDDAYSDALTEARANAVDDLLWQLADRKDTNVVIYGIGKDEPINANDTRDHRRANRRVEFYIVPLR